MFFDKFLDFIDVYAGVQEEEIEFLCRSRKKAQNPQKAEGRNPSRRERSLDDDPFEK